MLEVWPWTHRPGRHRPGTGHTKATLEALERRLAREEAKLELAEERTGQLDRLAVDVRRAFGLGGDGR